MVKTEINDAKEALAQLFETITLTTLAKIVRDTEGIPNQFISTALEVVPSYILQYPTTVSAVLGMLTRLHEKIEVVFTHSTPGEIKEKYRTFRIQIENAQEWMQVGKVSQTNRERN